MRWRRRWGEAEAAPEGRAEGGGWARGGPVGLEFLTGRKRSRDWIGGEGGWSGLSTFGLKVVGSHPTSSRGKWDAGVWGEVGRQREIWEIPPKRHLRHLRTYPSES